MLLEVKKLSDSQKKQNESLKKLPDFDSHPLVKMYARTRKIRRGR